MLKDVNLCTVESGERGNKTILSAHSTRSTSPPPPAATLYPTPPLLATPAARLSHADVISVPTSEAYGNVTRRRWTRWLLLCSRGGGGVHAAPLHARCGLNRDIGAGALISTRGVLEMLPGETSSPGDERWHLFTTEARHWGGALHTEPEPTIAQLDSKTRTVWSCT